jgi:hypothetical protein
MRPSKIIIILIRLPAKSYGMKHHLKIDLEKYCTMSSVALIAPMDGVPMATTIGAYFANMNPTGSPSGNGVRSSNRAVFYPLSALEPIKAFLAQTALRFR